MSYCVPRCVPPEFVGQTTATLQAWLTDAQNALQQLALGSKAVSLSYNTGAGGKSVTYQATDMGMLQQRIDALAYALGLAPRRSAMRPGF
jgi:hypothetical protein